MHVKSVWRVIFIQTKLLPLGNLQLDMYKIISIFYNQDYKKTLFLPTKTTIQSEFNELHLFIYIYIFFF